MTGPRVFLGRIAFGDCTSSSTFTVIGRGDYRRRIWRLWVRIKYFRRVSALGDAIRWRLADLRAWRWLALPKESARIAAESMRLLNKFAKGPASEPQTRAIYLLKERLVFELWHACPCPCSAREVEQVLPCRSCGGTGEWDYRDTCRRCDGTGVFRTHRLIEFRFDFPNGNVITFHQPRSIATWYKQEHSTIGKFDDQRPQSYRLLADREYRFHMAVVGRWVNAQGLQLDRVWGNPSLFSALHTDLKHLWRRMAERVRGLGAKPIVDDDLPF